MSSEGLDPSERELLDAEMTLFAAKTLVARLEEAKKTRKSGEAIHIYGQVDGASYAAYIPSDNEIGE